LPKNKVSEKNAWERSSKKLVSRGKGRSRRAVLVMTDLGAILDRPYLEKTSLVVEEAVIAKGDRVMP